MEQVFLQLIPLHRLLVNQNFVPITPELAALFRQHWQSLVIPGTWQEKMNMPFRQLLHDGFWELIKDGRYQSAQMVGEPSSLLQLTLRVDGGRFAPDLWLLLQQPEARHALHAQLLQTYFVDTEPVPTIQASDLLERETKQLLAEANAKFRIRRQRQEDDAGVFVRHALFPSVIKSLYGQACAVCRVDTRTEIGLTVVDAEHILPFAVYHHDDPRNGLALCKDHHWGFDAGTFAVDDGFSVVASKRIVETKPLVKTGTRLMVPMKPEYGPAREALRWHQEHVFLK